MQVNLIWAQARNGVIGKEGVMPWHLPEDLAHLKALTLGWPVIMGRTTWESIPLRFRPLPGRTNIVLTRSADWHAIGALRAGNIDHALQMCKQFQPVPDKVWVIGGAQIYAQALPLATHAEVTLIDADFEGDTHAPQFGPGWSQTGCVHGTSKTGLRYSFLTWERLASPASTQHT